MTGNNSQSRVRRTPEDFKESFRDILRTLNKISPEELEAKKVVMRVIGDELKLSVEVRQRLQQEAKAEVDNERKRNEGNGM